MYKNLVIGVGQIGTAISAILNCEGIDINDKAEYKTYKYLHICFPYSDRFIEYVENYRELYSPDHIIIHSTVPVGTSNKLNAVHSPCTGRHPNLEEGIRLFTKFFAGIGAYECGMLFKEKGINVHISNNADDTEAMKIMSTTYYGLNIMIEKEIYKWCKKNRLNFDLVYTKSNLDYNKGYKELGEEQFIRPNLKHVEGKIGGHCVTNNLDLIDDFWLADLLKEQNEQYY